MKEKVTKKKAKEKKKSRRTLLESLKNQAKCLFLKISNDV